MDYNSSFENKQFNVDHSVYDNLNDTLVNTCPCLSLQVLPCNLWLTVKLDTNATPVAHHTHVPVPLHWQDEVKAGLDQDVRLGVPIRENQSLGVTAW